MAYGWQIFNEHGALVADQSVIMSRRLGYYDVPFMRATAAGWSTQIAVNFNGGTPFVHCTVIEGAVTPAGMVYSPIIPDVVISGNIITLTYVWQKLAYPDDLGSPLCVGGIRVHYGVYNQ